MRHRRTLNRLTESTSMAADTVSRKRRFRSALALAGLTAAEFAGMQGVTPQHVSYVLSGKRTSAVVSDAIDRFIEMVTRKHGVAA